MVEGDRRDDELEPLPPLDGDGNDPPADDRDDYGDLLEDAAEDATLDDATAEDDPPDLKELDLDHAEGGLTVDSGEAQDLDLGEETAIADFGEETADPADMEEQGETEEDYGLGDSPERGGLDAGDEGPLDADEELRDADLPALDADEEGDMEDAALVDAGFASDEPLGLPWAATPWLRVGAPVSIVGATAVVCAPRGALAAGRSESGGVELVRVDLEGSWERIAGEGLGSAAVVALAVDGPCVAVVLQGGRLLSSVDGGATFAAVVEPMGDGILAADAIFAHGRLWVRTRSGGLVALQPAAPAAEHVPRGRPLRSGREREWSAIDRCAVPGVASALACDGAAGSAVVLVVDELARPTALVRAAADASVRCEPIEAAPASSPALLAVRGEHVAYAARHHGVVRRVGGGAWSRPEWEGKVTALAFIDDAGTLVVATYSDVDDTSALVRVEPGGKATVVARTGANAADADSDGRVTALAYDEARGVVWAAGGFGLVAFGAR